MRFLTIKKDLPERATNCSECRKVLVKNNTSILFLWQMSNMNLSNRLCPDCARLTLVQLNDEIVQLLQPERK